MSYMNCWNDYEHKREGERDAEYGRRPNDDYQEQAYQDSESCGAAYMDAYRAEERRIEERAEERRYEEACERRRHEAAEYEREIEERMYEQQQYPEQPYPEEPCPAQEPAVADAKEPQ